MYTVIFSPQAKKDIKALAQVYEKAVAQAIEDLKENPGMGKPLVRELKGRYSYRIHAYRIIYIIHQEEKRVVILLAGHRSTIYQ